ncbi:MAG TPA: rhodanese-like domain-containing protein [Armatimonadota bacterium]|jgi:rhodanese-related sulfurtransferase
MGLLKTLFGRPTEDAVTPAAAAELVKAGAFALDVRTPGEFSAGRIPGAHNIPVDRLKGRASEAPRDRTVVVICLSGHRSRMAIGQLRALGYTDLVNLSGGMMAWRAAGLPMER